MKKYFILISFTFICFACSDSTSGPDICDCIDNLTKIDTPQYDAAFSKKCEDYAKTLSRKEAYERVKEAIRKGCLNLIGDTLYGKNGKKIILSSVYNN
jgi:hypothetical protein